MILKAGYVIAQFGVGVVLARALGPAALGTYAFIVAVVQVLVILGQWGIPTLLVRRLAVDLQTGHLVETKGRIASALIVVAMTSFLVSAGWALISGLTGSSRSDMGGLVIVLVIAVALGSVIGGALRGLGSVSFSLMADETLRPWFLLGFIGVSMAFGAALDPRAALAIHAVAAVSALVISAMLLRHNMPNCVEQEAIVWQIPASLRLGLPFLLLAGAQTVGYQTDTILLGILTPGTPVGLYRTAAQVAESVSVLLFAISTVIGPHLARAEGDPDRLRAILIDAHRIGLALMAPMMLVVLFAGDWVVTTMFGSDYISAIPAMHILVLGKMLYATTGFVGLALGMIGRAWQAAGIAAAVILLNVVLDLVLIPRLGIEGAAIADTSSNFMVNLAGALYLRHLLGGRGVSAIAVKSKKRNASSA